MGSPVSIGGVVIFSPLCPTHKIKNPEKAAPHTRKEGGPHAHIHIPYTHYPGIQGKGIEYLKNFFWKIYK